MVGGIYAGECTESIRRAVNRGSLFRVLTIDVIFFIYLMRWLHINITINNIK